ncbi:MAG: sigma-70 family RNA polymerase sigma factor [Armatimonadetes bacterium]|nr:sigma-70 family RNA polymerase sigma factor [Armatimonadota bacterium]
MIFTPVAGPLNPSARLLQRARDGDSEALHQLLDPHWETVYRLAYRITGHVEDAEDLAQEAFVRIIHRLHTFRGECEFRTWVYRVALNVCLSSRRRRRPETECFDALLLRDRTPGPEEHLLQRSFQRRVCEEIRKLHPSYAEVLLLRLIEEMEYPEIAGVLRLSTKTAQLRFHRGMKRLRERLKPWMDEEIEG